MENKEKDKLLKRLKYRYRLVIMTENTFEEKLALSLTPMNVFVLFSSILVVFTAIVISLIIFTPIREYIPGYSDRNTARNIEKLLNKTEKLEREIQQKDRYIKTLQDIFNGKTISPDSIQALGDSALGMIQKRIDEKLTVIENRENLERADQKLNNNPLASYYFFTPLKGYITSDFDPSTQHYAVDIAGKADQPVKVTLDGTVIFSAWTPGTGHVIGVQHANNMVSVYKHNSVLLKKEGAYVNAGEPIAIIGNSGEYTSGPHLHFELWHNGTAVNPQDFMVF